MGPTPKLAWGWWFADQIVDPFIGKGQMSDSRPSALQVWKDGNLWGYRVNSIPDAYEAAKDRFFLNVGGYSTRHGKFFPLDDPKVMRTWKTAVAPAAATVVDWGFSWLVGYHPPRVGRFALVGHRRQRR